MTLKAQYDKAKDNLLQEKSINKANRVLFKRFFEFQEVKLKRMNGISSLDDGTYRTLISYCYRFKIVNKWFDNKDFTKITKKEFEKVFNDLCDGKIFNAKGEPVKDIHSYVYKIFKSKLFNMAGLSSIVDEVTEFYKGNNDTEASFLEEKEVNQIVDNSKGKMKLLYQLGYDIGENVSALLQLQKKDCRKQYNEVTKAYDYHIHLKKETLKRARQERTEPTRFSKTVELLDLYLKDLDDNDYLFARELNAIRRQGVNKEENIPMSLRAVEIHFDKLVSDLKLKTIPKGDKPKLKDIRSSMACDCLKKGWSSEEINGRLGHSVTSKMLKPYISFLALDKGKPKIREYKENIEGLNDKMQEQKNINLLLDKRLQEQTKETERIKEQIKNSFNKDSLKKALEELYSEGLVIGKRKSH